jgi:hypothetical protein
MITAREKHIKLLVAKFVKLVESLNPGERLSIRKVTATKGARAGKPGNKRKIGPKRAIAKTRGIDKTKAVSETRAARETKAREK